MYMTASGDQVNHDDDQLESVIRRFVAGYKKIIREEMTQGLDRIFEEVLEEERLKEKKQ